MKNKILNKKFHKKALKEFNKLSKKYPTMRFCQLFVNVVERGGMHKCDSRIFYVENDVFIQMIKDFDKQFDKQNEEK